MSAAILHLIHIVILQGFLSLSLSSAVSVHLLPPGMLSLLCTLQLLISHVLQLLLGILSLLCALLLPPEMLSLMCSPTAYMAAQSLSPFSSSASWNPQTLMCSPAASRNAQSLMCSLAASRNVQSLMCFPAPEILSLSYVVLLLSTEMLSHTCSPAASRNVQFLKCSPASSWNSQYLMCSPATSRNAQSHM